MFHVLNDCANMNYGKLHFTSPCCERRNIAVVGVKVLVVAGSSGYRSASSFGLGLLFHPAMPLSSAVSDQATVVSTHKSFRYSTFHSKCFKLSLGLNEA